MHNMMQKLLNERHFTEEMMALFAKKVSVKVAAIIAHIQKKEVVFLKMRMTIE